MGQERVGGVIFFHSITGARLTGVDRNNLRILTSICGEGFYPHVAFVTTKWDCINTTEHEKLVDRHNAIEVERRKILPEGPEIFQFLNDGKSHQPVLKYFAQLVKTDIAAPPLQFVEELERYYKTRKVSDVTSTAVKKTKAGKEIIETSRKVGAGSWCTIL
jgi:hypothetical protein